MLFYVVLLWLKVLDHKQVMTVSSPKPLLLEYAPLFVSWLQYPFLKMSRTWRAKLDPKFPINQLGNLSVEIRESFREATHRQAGPTQAPLRLDLSSPPHSY
jgi:hypothetical protein